MRVYSITMVYAGIDILEHGIKNLLETCGTRPDEFLFLDNHWPMAKENHQEEIKRISTSVNGHIFDDGKNWGGTIGVNRLVQEADKLGCTDDDFILYSDPDQNIITNGWLTAMLDVMKADPNVSVVCLWPYQQMRSDWKESKIAGHNIRTFPAPDMYSVHLYRRSFIGSGIEGWRSFYGFIEPPAFEKAKRLGMYPAYLYDFKEAPCPIPHHKRYTRWKALHVSNSFTGDFSQYLKAHS